MRSALLVLCLFVLQFAISVRGTFVDDYSFQGDEETNVKWCSSQNVLTAPHKVHLAPEKELNVTLTVRKPGKGYEKVKILFLLEIPRFRPEVVRKDLLDELEQGFQHHFENWLNVLDNGGTCYLSYLGNNINHCTNPVIQLRLATFGWERTRRLFNSGEYQAKETLTKTWWDYGNDIIGKKFTYDTAEPTNPPSLYRLFRGYLKDVKDSRNNDYFFDPSNKLSWWMDALSKMADNNGNSVFGTDSATRVVILFTGKSYLFGDDFGNNRQKLVDLGKKLAMANIFPIFSYTRQSWYDGTGPNEVTNLVQTMKVGMWMDDKRDQLMRTSVCTIVQSLHFPLAKQTSSLDYTLPVWVLSDEKVCGAETQSTSSWLINPAFQDFVVGKNSEGFVTTANYASFASTKQLTVPMMTTGTSSGTVELLVVGLGRVTIAVDVFSIHCSSRSYFATNEYTSGTYSGRYLIIDQNYLYTYGSGAKPPSICFTELPERYIQSYLNRRRLTTIRQYNRRVCSRYYPYKYTSRYTQDIGTNQLYHPASYYQTSTKVDYGKCTVTYNVALAETVDHWELIIYNRIEYTGTGYIRYTLVDNTWNKNIRLGDCSLQIMWNPQVSVPGWLTYSYLPPGETPLRTNEDTPLVVELKSHDPDGKPTTIYYDRRWVHGGYYSRWVGLPEVWQYDGNQPENKGTKIQPWTTWYQAWEKVTDSEHRVVVQPLLDAYGSNSARIYYYNVTCPAGRSYVYRASYTLLAHMGPSRKGFHEYNYWGRIFYRIQGGDTIGRYLHVVPVNDAPRGNNPQVSVMEGLKSTTESLSSGFSDPEKDAMTFSVKSLPQYGKLYQAAGDYSEITSVPTTIVHPLEKLAYLGTTDRYGPGADSFKISATDSHGAESSDYTVYVNIRDQPDPPIGFDPGVQIMNESQAQAVLLTVMSVDDPQLAQTGMQISRPVTGSLYLCDVSKTGPRGSPLAANAYIPQSERDSNSVGSGHWNNTFCLWYVPKQYEHKNDPNYVSKKFYYVPGETHSGVTRYGTPVEVSYSIELVNDPPTAKLPGTPSGGWGEVKCVEQLPCLFRLEGKDDIDGDISFDIYVNKLPHEGSLFQDSNGAKGGAFSVDAKVANSSGYVWFESNSDSIGYNVTFFTYVVNDEPSHNDGTGLSSPLAPVAISVANCPDQPVISYSPAEAVVNETTRDEKTGLAITLIGTSVDNVPMSKFEVSYIFHLTIGKLYQCATENTKGAIIVNDKTWTRLTLASDNSACVWFEPLLNNYSTPEFPHDKFKIRAFAYSSPRDSHCPSTIPPEVTEAKEVHITINSVNDRPFVDLSRWEFELGYSWCKNYQQFLPTTEEKATTITLHARDVDNSDGDVSAIINGLPSHGVLYTGEASGSTCPGSAITATPHEVIYPRKICYLGNKDFFGEDSFTYRAKDTHDAESDTCNVKLVLSNVADSPYGNVSTLQGDTTFACDEDSGGMAIVVTGTTVDETSVRAQVNARTLSRGILYQCDGEESCSGCSAKSSASPITYDDARPFVNLKCKVGAEKWAVWYEPFQHAHGNDSFRFRIEDTSKLSCAKKFYPVDGDSSDPDVTITIRPKNDAPFVEDRTVVVEKEKETCIRLLAQDTVRDVDGQFLLAQVRTVPGKGTIYQTEQCGTPDTQTSQTCQDNGLCIGTEITEVTNVTDANGWIAYLSNSDPGVVYDSFQYDVFDNISSSSVATLNLKVEDAWVDAVIQMESGYSTGTIQEDPRDSNTTLCPRIAFSGSTTGSGTVTKAKIAVLNVASSTFGTFYLDSGCTNELAVLSGEVEVDKIDTLNGGKKAVFAFYFLPHLNFNGYVNVSLNCYTHGVTFAGYNALPAVESFYITPVNDPPVTRFVNPAVVGNLTNTNITLSGADVESSTVSAVVKTLPFQSRLYQVNMDGTPGALIDSVPTTVALTYNTVLYNNTEPDCDADQFTYVVKDDDNVESAPFEVHITVLESPVLPVIDDVQSSGTEDTGFRIKITGSAVNDIKINATQVFLSAIDFANGDLYQCVGDCDSAASRTDAVAIPANYSVPVNVANRLTEWSVVPAQFALYYEPHANKHTLVGRTYLDRLFAKVVDSQGLSSLPVAVNIDVQSVNDVPTVPSTLSPDGVIFEGVNSTIALKGHDNDTGESEILIARVQSLPAKGKLYQYCDDESGGIGGDEITVAGTNVTDPLRRVAYNSDSPTDKGTSYASFTYDVTDGLAWSSSCTVNIDVTNTVDYPTATVTPNPVEVKENSTGVTIRLSGQSNDQPSVTNVTVAVEIVRMEKGQLWQCVPNGGGVCCEGYGSPLTGHRNVITTGVDKFTYTVFYKPDNSTHAPDGTDDTQDLFYFRVTDNHGFESPLYPVPITVNPVNDKPLATMHELCVQKVVEQEPSLIHLMGYDVDDSTDSLVARIVSFPSKGQLYQNAGTLVDPVAGAEINASFPNVTSARRVLFNSQTDEVVPNSANSGHFASFSYILIDDEGAESAPATVYVDVLNVWDRPVAKHSPLNPVEAEEDTPGFAVKLMGTTVDPDDNMTQAVVVIPASFSGKLFQCTGECTGPGTEITERDGNVEILNVINAMNYTVWYRPAKDATPGYDGSPKDTFGWKVRDTQCSLEKQSGLGDVSDCYSVIDTVEIQVSPVNDVPIPYRDEGHEVYATERRSKLIELSGSDVEGDAFSAEIALFPSKGKIYRDPSLMNEITPADNSTNNDRIIYFISTTTEVAYNFATMSYVLKEDVGGATSEPYLLNIDVLNICDDVTGTHSPLATREDVGMAITLTGSSVDPDTTMTEAKVVAYGSWTNQPMKGRLYQCNSVACTGHGSEILQDGNSHAVTTQIPPNQFRVWYEPPADQHSDGKSPFEYFMYTIRGVMDPASPFYVPTAPCDSWFSGEASIVVLSVNDPPLCTNLSLVAIEQQYITITMPFSDVDDTRVKAQVAQFPQKGLLFSIDGSPITAQYPNITQGDGETVIDLKYVSPSDEFGFTDVFQYQLIDSAGGNATCKVEVSVINGPDAPTVSYYPNPMRSDEDVPFVVTLVGHTIDAPDVHVDSMWAKAFSSENGASSGQFFECETPECTAPSSVQIPSDAFWNVTSRSGNNFTLYYIPKLNLFQEDFDVPADYFSYYVLDSQNWKSPIVEVPVYLSPVNDPPSSLLTPNPGELVEDETIIFTYSAEDIDHDDESLRCFIATPPLSEHGALFDGGNDSLPLFADSEVEDVDRTFSFAPATNWNGKTWFTYYVKDPGNDTSPHYNVSITVTPVEDNPVGTDTVVDISEDTVGTFSLLCSDPDIGDTLSAKIVDPPPSIGQLYQYDAGAADHKGAPITNCSLHGYCNVTDPQWRLTFEPKPDEFASPYTLFLFKVQDQTQRFSDAATCTINIINVNDPPVTEGGVVNLLEDEGTQIMLLVTDVDEVEPAPTFNITSLPTCLQQDVPCVFTTGDAVPIDREGFLTKNKYLFFRPAPNENSSPYANFSYYAIDDHNATSNESVFSISVAAVNDLPVVKPLPAQIIDEDTKHVITLKGEDVDGPFAEPEIYITRTPARGSVHQYDENAEDYVGGKLTNCDDVSCKLNDAGGRCMFVPRPNDGLLDLYDIITYQLYDGAEWTNEEAIYVYVIPVNDPIRITMFQENATVAPNKELIVQNVSVADIDVGTNDVIVEVKAENGTVNFVEQMQLAILVNKPNHMQVSGTLEAVNRALAAVKYVSNPFANGNGEDEITFTANDQGFTGKGGATTDEKKIKVHIRSPVELGKEESSNTEVIYGVSAAGAVAIALLFRFHQRRREFGDIGSDREEEMQARAKSQTFVDNPLFAYVLGQDMGDGDIQMNDLGGGTGKSDATEAGGAGGATSAEVAAAEGQAAARV